jgi:hypothetical protein
LSLQVKETLVFLVHSIKQFCSGFERLDEVARSCEAGCAPTAFYMSAIYQHIAVFYLLDKGQQDAMGGTFYKALKTIGQERLLEPIQEVLDTPIGSTTFGELVRAFRNKVIVHTIYRDADLDRLYKHANMEDPLIATKFQETLLDVYHVTRLLAPELIERAGYRLADFGIRELPPTPQDEWERRLLATSTNCGVSLPDATLSSDELHDTEDH